LSKILAYAVESFLRKTGLVSGVLSYHLSPLEKSDVIKVVRQPRATRYYLVTVPDKEYKILKFVRHKPVRQKMIFLLERDLYTFDKIVDHMQKAPSTVSLLLPRLSDGNRYLIGMANTNFTA
jgi:DNA-binding transcriptional ArsR family regulator